LRKTHENCRPLLALTLLALTHSSHAADEGTAAVTALGELNGIALACKQPALVSRARNIIVTTAPKTRDFGEIFENATNAAFLSKARARPLPR
jgi:hypothetical protein